MAVFPAHEARILVEVLAVELSSAGVELMCGSVSERFGQHADAPVVVSIFQSLRHRFQLLVARDVAQGVLVMFGHRHQGIVEKVAGGCDGRQSVILRAAPTRPESQLRIEAPVAFHISVCDDGNGVIAYHRAGIVARQLPHREHSPVLILLQQGLDVEGVLCRVDDGQQGVQGAERVPQRKYRVHRLAFRSRVYFPV